MESSVFTKMVRGEIPFQKIYEDSLTLAFLDHNPLTEGHTLVIPKQEIDILDDCPPELYSAIFKTVHKVSKHLQGKLQPLRVALVVHGLDVPHAHIHLIPLYKGNELRLAHRKEPEPDINKLEKLEAKLKFPNL